MGKVRFKDILNVTITDAKKSVKGLTAKQLDSISEKLQKLSAIANAESDKRFRAALEEELDREVEEAMIFDDDEVQEDA